VIRSANLLVLGPVLDLTWLAAVAFVMTRKKLHTALAVHFSTGRALPMVVTLVLFVLSFFLLVLTIPSTVLFVPFPVRALACGVAELITVKSITVALAILI
jgi:hypothetical protein